MKTPVVHFRYRKDKVMDFAPCGAESGKKMTTKIICSHDIDCVTCPECIRIAKESVVRHHASFHMSVNYRDGKMEDLITLIPSPEDRSPAKTTVALMMVSGHAKSLKEIFGEEQLSYQSGQGRKSLWFLKYEERPIVITTGVRSETTFEILSSDADNGHMPPSWWEKFATQFIKQICTTEHGAKQWEALKSVEADAMALIRAKTEQSDV